MTSTAQSIIFNARRQLHENLKLSLFKTDAGGIPSIADKGSKASVAFAKGIFDRLNVAQGTRKIAQTSGTQFEALIEKYLNETFMRATPLRPGNWIVTRSGTRIDQYQQYLHLADIQTAIKEDKSLAASIGQDYLIRPDIVILRKPEPEEVINSADVLIDPKIAKLTGLLKSNNEHNMLHASVSCKWTLRSDRAQNARSEGLNLTRNRKGRVPHVVVVTSEPLPSRIASLALGTGDIDFVYHVALDELKASIEDTEYDDSKELIRTMICGSRLRDISDLPLDLLI